uniref:sulfite exporter TauE/SafE family protein n=1 Tax=Herbidospora sakaeratensis TaxID=564415 RepID=UPI000781C8C7|nr:TSUP family transporter [Herbidospora sakaeratensis]
MAAGWVDAVVGGGGLLQLPALLLAGLTPVEALATNKSASVLGTTSAAYTYARRTGVDRIAVPAGVAAVLSSAGGALLAALLDPAVLKPLIIVILVGVAAFVALRPSFGAVALPNRRTRARLVVAVLAAGVAIAFYDGLIGPGTGTFLIIVFTSVIGMDFVRASATSKIINMGTNVGAIAVFAAQGHVVWALGLAMGVANIAGAQLGARMALKRGAGFVRVVLLTVVSALVLRLGWDLL